MGAIGKQSLNEQQIRDQCITPAIEQAGWEKPMHLREEVTLTQGRIIVRGSLVTRGDSSRADYVLYHQPNLPLAVVEAKDNKHTVGAGMQQALAYAEMLDVPFAYSSNGDAFLEHDRRGASGQIERELPLHAFPRPDELWERYCAWKGIDEIQRQLVTEPYHQGTKRPRYYQMTAVNRTIEAIAKGQNRVLLVMATGTGKTFTAFQIIWRLWRAGRAERILFLADRNILVDQARVNDFRPFGQQMTKITHRQVDKSYEVYLALYQAISGTEASMDVYKDFSPDFFDLVIVDECHRGSAAEDSVWREILEYFSSAIQIGMTATPKETEYVSNIDYFGKPVYIYSLKQGIQDGFLAPYKVVRIDFDRDLLGWRPEQGQRDKHGRLIEDRVYNQRDMDRELVLEQRTKLVARKVTEFLKATDRYAKTIVFCEDIEHAERMRQELVNENADLAASNRRYVMRITGDNQEGKAELDNFIDPESDYPVIATTSRLMTTGVDTQTAKLIVLDRRIQAMTEFKQIIGRGTRVHEDYGKYYFTIIDTKKATELFADPDFDGEPVQVYEPGPEDSPVPSEEEATEEEETSADERRRRLKYVVDDVPVRILAERVQYYDKQGKLITESLRDYTRKMVHQEYVSLDAFLKSWGDAEKKQAIIEELEAQGVLWEALAEEVGKDIDPFDLICHIVYDRPPLTRRERAERARKSDVFEAYGDQARAVLDALLDKYADEGIENIESLEVLRIQPFTQLGTPLEIIQEFGGKEQYLQALRTLEQQLYAA